MNSKINKQFFKLNAGYQNSNTKIIFTIRKADNRTIYVSVTPTNVNRKVTFEAYRGNSWQTITILQNSNNR